MVLLGSRDVVGEGGGSSQTAKYSGIWMPSTEISKEAELLLILALCMSRVC